MFEQDPLAALSELDGVPAPFSFYWVVARINRRRGGPVVLLSANVPWLIAAWSGFNPRTVSSDFVYSSSSRADNSYPARN